MERSKQAAAQEWRDRWPLVMAALVGGSFAGIPIYSMTFFIDPLTDEFGWSHTQAAFGLTLIAIVGVPLSPFVGALVDEWGPRRLAKIGIVTSSLMLGSLGLTTGSIALWTVQWLIYALVILALKTTVWTAAVGRVFDSGRGMAIAATLCGTAIAQTLAPLFSYGLIEAVGWRYAYIAMAAGWGGLAFIFVFFCFHDGRDAASTNMPAGEPATATPVALTGLTVKEAVRNPIIYRIALALAIASLLSMTVITHKVSILAEMAIPRSSAALIASTAGIAGISGKLIAGWLYDRSASQWIGAFAFGLPAVGFVLMTEPIRTPLLIVASMILLGFGAGASLQATVYLITRYIGMRNYGKVFGTVSIIMVFGVGAGPVLGGAIYDRFHSYEPLLVAGGPLALFAGLLVLGLGPYPRWDMPTKLPAIGVTQTHAPAASAERLGSAL
jgi:MFS family permease